MKCFYPVESANGLRPCGQCAACLVNKQIQWKFRLEQEILVNDVAFWLTLQYDDEHLPRSNGIPCVCKLHCQNYFRQIRKQLVSVGLETSFKYFLVAEYGPNTLRPHYHVLLLFKLPKISFERMLEMRQFLYNILKERWYHGHVEEKLFHSGVIKYLSKYVFKPFKDYNPPVPLFRLISKGIGEVYLEKVDKDALVQKLWRTPYGVLPRYYRDKLFPTTNKANPEHIRNSQIRNEIFNKSLDDAYTKSLLEFSFCGKDVEKYIRRQNYLLRCQMRMVERKQKEKYG